jgi:hypothetical protein
VPLRDVILICGAAASLLAGVRLLTLWWKFRGQRVIICPENHAAAGVVVDSRHAAWTGATHLPQLRLSECSRWPEKQGCGQECLSQIEGAPEDCMVQHILVKWYAGKACACCGRPISEILPGASKPALLLADGVSVEWGEIAAELVPATLAAAKPICFACHMAQKLVREYPEMVVYRHLPAEQASKVISAGRE